MAIYKCIKNSVLQAKLSIYINFACKQRHLRSFLAKGCYQQSGVVFLRIKFFLHKKEAARI